MMRLMVFVQRAGVGSAGSSLSRAPARAAGVAVAPIFVFVWLFLALVLAPDAATFEEELDDESEQGNGATEPVQQCALPFGPGDRIQVAQLVREAKAAVRQEERADEAGQGHCPEAKQQQSDQASNQEAQQRLV